MSEPMDTTQVLDLVEQARREARAEEDSVESGVLLRRAGAAGAPALDVGVGLLAVADPGERTLGCDLLGETADQNEPLCAAAADALVALAAHETDAGVLRSLAWALECTHDPRAVPVLVTLAGHEDPGVRSQVAGSFAGVLTGSPDGPDIDALIRLSRDSDPTVRDWATFTLGFQAETDSSAIRDALWERTADSEAEVRKEAVRGLARRHDPQALSLLRPFLEDPEGTDSLTFLAAAIVGRPELLPVLAECDADVPGVADAIEACDPSRRARLDDFAWQLVCAVERSHPGLGAAVWMPRFDPGLNLCLGGASSAAAYDMAAYDVAALMARADGDLARAVDVLREDQLG